MEKKSIDFIVLRKTNHFLDIEEFWTQVFKTEGLKRLERKEFYRVDRRIWTKRIRKYQEDVYCVVENPIEAGNYRELVDILLECDGFYRLWVKGNKPHDSMKPYSDQLTTDVVERMIKMAEENIWKKNYFEAKFSCSRDCKKSGMIGFTEYDKRIVGYDVSFSYEQRSLITIEGLEGQEFGYIHGLWLPKDYVQRSSEMKKIRTNQKNI